MLASSSHDGRDFLSSFIAKVSTIPGEMATCRTAAFSGGFKTPQPLSSSSFNDKQKYEFLVPFTVNISIIRYYVIGIFYWSELSPDNGNARPRGGVMFV